MAKKSSKKQPKQPNAANVGDTATAQSITALLDDTSSATRVAFCEFIELVDLSSIKVFISTAASSPEGENLKLLWGCAFKEGLTAGHLLHGKTEERLKEVQAEAYEEGYQAGYEEGHCDEHGDWALEGHGIHCRDRTGIPYDDYGTPATATASVSTQTDPQDTRYIPILFSAMSRCKRIL